MQFTSFITILSAVAAVVVAQGPPQCSLSCLANTPTNGCDGADPACLCHNTAFIAAQTQCITAACTNPSDLQQAQAFAQANCLAVGVTLSAPPPSSTSAASAGSPSSTSPASGSTAPAPTPTSAASAVSAPIVLLAGVVIGVLAL